MQDTEAHPAIVPKHSSHIMRHVGGPENLKRGVSSSTPRSQPRDYHSGKISVYQEKEVYMLRSPS